jgi:hypothetical protein
MDIVNDYQSNYGTGWIKLFRSLQYKGWYKKSDYVHLWIHILIRSNHKGIELMFGGKNIKLNPGQFVTGRKSLSSETGINESKIERILKFFEKSEQQIEQQKSNKNRIITVVSWSDYQQSEQQSEQQVNNNRTTSEQQVNTNKNIKKEKNYNNKKESIKKRETIFKNKIFEHTQTYSTEMLDSFFDYWSETNKSGTKMKFELNKTWDLSKRLKTWERNEASFGGGKSKFEDKEKQKFLREENARLMMEKLKANGN